MLDIILLIAGGLALASLGYLVCFAMMMAVMGNPPDTAAANILLNIQAGLIYSTPVWVLICLFGYATGWVFGTGLERGLWILATLVPIALQFCWFGLAHLFIKNPE